MTITSTKARTVRVPTTRPTTEKTPPLEASPPPSAWAPKQGRRGDLAPLSSVGWARQDSRASLVGTFAATGAGLRSISFGDDGKATLVGTNGSTSTADFAVGNGGAAFTDTLAFKRSDGSLRLFVVDEVKRNAKGSITSLHLGEFVDGSPTNIEPVVLER